MLKKVFRFILLVLFIPISYSFANTTAKSSELEISNNYFSFTMPAEVQNTYSVEKVNNGIYISEKFSKASGNGGFAFAFKIYESPQDYVGSDGVKKIGELTAKTGFRYDMVLIRPDEVKYMEGEKIAENYNRLYNLADNIIIKGVNGNIYNKNQGMKGKDLYSAILKKYKKIFDENWTTVEQYKSAKMNTAYYYFFKPNEKLADEIGYTYYDINSDGIDELIIGKIAKGKFKGIIYDLYTMVNREPQLVLSGNNTDKYFICNNNFICNEKVLSKNENRLIVFGLDNNSVRMYPQIIFTYNTIANKKEPWFISSHFTDEKENVSKKTFNERKNIYCKKYNRFDFIPFSKL